ncbi:MAG TPA: mycofactocin biosynthesis peptidyl-dipeptidase MftE [Acidimicrobiales bacterium]|jgi:creatinine amidohydrolase
MGLAGSTWEEVAATGGRRVLVIPFGSFEQHGPHLPLDTDTQIAVALADGLCRARPDVVRAPAVAYGASGEHAGFPGTLLVHHDVLAELVIELVRSAREAFRGVVLLSAHGGNGEAMVRAEALCRADGEAALFWSPRTEGDAHAGRTETSLMLAIAPDSVRMALAAPGCTEPLQSILPRLRTEGVRPISSNGVLGDPTGANADEGRVLLDALTRDLRDAVLARWPEEPV